MSDPCKVARMIVTTLLVIIFLVEAMKAIVKWKRQDITKTFSSEPIENSQFPSFSFVRVPNVNTTSPTTFDDLETLPNFVPFFSMELQNGTTLQCQSGDTECSTTVGEWLTTISANHKGRLVKVFNFSPSSGTGQQIRHVVSLEVSMIQVIKSNLTLQ